MWNLCQFVKFVSRSEAPPRWCYCVNLDARKWSLAAVLIFIMPTGFSQAAPQVVPLTSPQLWQRLEFTISNVPSVGNPFDPDSIRLDAAFTFPSGRAMVVPAFWYQDYQRSLSGGKEQDVPTGPSGWRLRLTPPETGSYALSLTIQTNGQLAGGPVTANFNVPTSPMPVRSGYVGIAPSRQYFQTGDGQALRLIGENVAWGDDPQTFRLFSKRSAGGDAHAESVFPGCGPRGAMAAGWRSIGTGRGRRPQNVEPRFLFVHERRIEAVERRAYPLNGR